MSWSIASLPSREYWSGGSITASAMMDFAAGKASETQSYIISLAESADGLTPPEITPEWPTIAGAPTPISTTAPAMQDVVWSLPNLPTAFSGTLDISTYLPDPFDENPPALSFGTAPAAPINSVPDAPGVNLAYDDPTLSVTLPAAPNLLSLNIETFDGVTVPTVDFTLPELSIVAPDIQQYAAGDLYTSSLLSALQSKLQSDIEDGGTGLSADVQSAIWDQGREREYRQRSAAQAELDQMETLGHSLPSGIWADMRLKLITETNHTATTISREIMVAEAELEQKNIHHALQMATSLEGKLIDYNNAVEQRLFESARYVTEAGIALYNAKAQAYGAYVEAYRAKVEIYKAQVQAELANVEAYKAEVAAEEAKARVNSALVDQYRAQIDAALSDIEVYKAEIMAIETKANIEKLKVQIFGEQVRAYGEQVNAYTAGVEGFRAQVSAETAKQDAYTSKVRAYSAGVDANVKAIEAQIREYEAQLRAKEVEWEGYKAAAAAESSRADAIAAYNRSQADSYQAEVAATSAYNDALTKQWQVSVDQAQRVTEIGVAAAKANAELYTTTRSLAMDASKVGAQVSAQLGASALGALSLSNSYSLSNSSGYSTAYSYSAQESTSESVSSSS